MSQTPLIFVKSETKTGILDLTKIVLQSVFTILDIYSENQKTVEKKDDIIAIQS